MRPINAYLPLILNTRIDAVRARYRIDFAVAIFREEPASPSPAAAGEFVFIQRRGFASSLLPAKGRKEILVILPPPFRKVTKSDNIAFAKFFVRYFLLDGDTAGEDTRCEEATPIFRVTSSIRRGDSRPPIFRGTISDDGHVRVFGKL